MLRKIRLHLAIVERSFTYGLLTVSESIHFALAGHASELEKTIKDLDADIYKESVEPVRNKLVRIKIYNEGK